ncbi:TPA: hypothetical protein ACU9T0_005991 [Burkholderia cenocepacia]|uniref:Pilus assembly protein n=1 Tax=Burkholderia vietnamiensis TaxID=60552 RepID=A0ABS1AXL9_BURVI|nr:hypothetical protein [Burkholderia vietnamiensis]MBJ9688849.1 hypothetical protein [Burkholderia vietnamiensis]
MGYVLLPIVMLMAFAGLIAQAAQWANTVPGAGLTGQLAQRAMERATQAEVFAHACLTAAQQQPGMIADPMMVTLPVGMTPIVGSRCATVRNGTARLIYAGVPSVPGAPATLEQMLKGSAFWYRVSSAGQAVAIVSGQAISVPATFASGTLLYQVRIEP